MNKLSLCVSGLIILGLIPALSANASDLSLIEKAAWAGHDNCKGAVMIQSRDRVGKNGRYMNEPKIMFYAEELTVPCLTGEPSKRDFRVSFLYYLEEKYPEKMPILKARIDMRSDIWSLSTSRERYERQKYQLSEYARTGLIPKGYEVIHVSGFEYVPGIYADREDRALESARISETYENRDFDVEY